MEQTLWKLMFQLYTFTYLLLKIYFMQIDKSVVHEYLNILFHYLRGRFSYKFLLYHYLQECFLVKI